MWKYLLRNKFEDHFLPQIHEIYMVPWSINEKMIGAFQIYVWTWVDYTSDCTVLCLGSTAGSLMSSTAETPTTSPSSDVSTSDSHQDSTGLPTVEADQNQEVVEDPSTAEPRQVGRERLDEQPFTLSYAKSVQQGISDVWLRSGEGERRWRQ